MDNKNTLLTDLSFVTGREIESRSGLRFRRMPREETAKGQRMRCYNDFRFEDFHLHEKR